MRKADETSNFFFGSLNISKIRNIFVMLIPIAIRGGFDKKKLPSQMREQSYKKYKHNYFGFL